MEKEKNKDAKLNKSLKITFIIFLISGIIALVIILNKGKIFGNNLVAVSNPEVQETVHSIQLTTDKLYLSKNGDTTEAMITIDGLDATEGYELTSSDETVAKIEDNTIKSVGVGTVIIKAKSTAYNVESEVTIDVVSPITSLTLESEFSSISVGGETQLSFTYKPSTATANLTYTSSDEEIATVNDSGIVTGKATGNVTITAEDSITGKKATCKIKIK